MLPIATTIGRGCERVLGAYFLFGAAGMLVLTALALKATSRGTLLVPDFFISKNWKRCDYERFRTTGPGSTRCRALAAFLRKYRLDELPVFISVTRGQTGLVEAFRHLMDHKRKTS